MTLQDFNDKYWNYYLMLEAKFVNTLSYVSLSQSNFNTYSNEYAHLIQAIGAELDSFFKEYCGFNPSDYKSISDYATFILQNWNDIKSQEVKANQLLLKPFDNWESARAKQSLPWWEAFDSIKHSRVANEAKGTLENTINILAALYIIEMKWFKEEADKTSQPDIPKVNSTLFHLENWNTRYNSTNGLMYTIQNEGLNLK